jgi:hypothetical protein
MHYSINRALVAFWTLESSSSTKSIYSVSVDFNAVQPKSFADATSVPSSDQYRIAFTNPPFQRVVINAPPLTQLMHNFKLHGSETHI